MPLVVKDRVRETTTTTGTGTVTLIGAVTGFQSFSVIGNGNTTFYTIALDSAGEWEVGIGTYTASGTTLSRDIVLESSNSGSLVPFSAGTKTVFCTYPAEKSVYYDASNNVGIGTSSPASKLSLYDTVDLSLTSGNAQFIIVGNGYSGFFALDATSFQIGQNSAVRSLTFHSGTGMPERMRIGPTGAIDMAATSSLQKNSINAYTLKNITYLTSGTAATYTTPTGVRALKVTVVGGGGGGGGVDGASTASTNAYSSGGGGGGYAMAFIATAEASYTYTVGAGGTGGAAGNNAGASGGTTEFKNAGATVVVSATGGAGGAGDTGATSTGALTGDPGIGSITGLGTPGGLVGSGTGREANGYGRFINGTLYSLTGSGYCPLIGGGVPTAAQATGTNATRYGEGGGPVRTSTASASNFAGGNGFAGLIIVEEYY